MWWCNCDTLASNHGTCFHLPFDVCIAFISSFSSLKIAICFQSTKSMIERFQSCLGSGCNLSFIVVGPYEWNLETLRNNNILLIVVYKRWHKIIFNFVIGSMLQFSSSEWNMPLLGSHSWFLLSLLQAIHLHLISVVLKCL